MSRLSDDDLDRIEKGLRGYHSEMYGCFACYRYGFGACGNPALVLVAEVRALRAERDAAYAVIRQHRPRCWDEPGSPDEDAALWAVLPENRSGDDG